MSDSSSDFCFSDETTCYFENLSEYRRHRVDKSVSVFVLRSRHGNYRKFTPRLGVSDSSPDYVEGMHPVQLGRRKLKVPAKFRRMDIEGGTSLGILAVGRPKSSYVQTLGEFIGMRTVKFKPSPLKVIKRRMKKWFKVESSPFSDEISSYLKSNTFSNALLGLYGQRDVSTQTDPFGSRTRHFDNVNFNQLRSLSELGINTEFLDYYEKQSLLDCAANLILQLNEEQYRRLSGGHKNHNNVETHLSKCLLSRLIPLAKSFTPGDLTSVETIHHILGIQI